MCKSVAVLSYRWCRTPFNVADTCSIRAASSTSRQPPKVLLPRLPPFISPGFPGPEPKVAAFLLENAINLRRLKQRLTDLDCPTVMWQGQVLFCSSSAGLGQQQCSAVFLSDGYAICWHMSRTTQRKVLNLAASTPAERRRRPTWPSG